MVFSSEFYVATDGADAIHYASSLSTTAVGTASLHADGSFKREISIEAKRLIKRAQHHKMLVNRRPGEERRGGGLKRKERQERRQSRQERQKRRERQSRKERQERQKRQKRQALKRTRKRKNT